jgi:hypothetical protein
MDDIRNLFPRHILVDLAGRGHRGLAIEHWRPRVMLGDEAALLGIPDDARALRFPFGVLRRSNPDDRLPRRIGAGAWFDRPRAASHQFTSIRYVSPTTRF